MKSSTLIIICMVILIFLGILWLNKGTKEGLEAVTTTGTGGSTAYTFTWTENGTIIGTGSSLTVDPINSGTNYCVTITEVCGSPNAQDCMTITFFPTIAASLIPDQVEKCAPAKFEFINTSFQ